MKHFIGVIILLLIIVGVVWVLTQQENDVAPIPEETLDEVEKLFDVEMISKEVVEGQAVLLDVRTSQELAEDGYAVGSTHFDLAHLQKGEMPDFLKDTKIYTYCKGGKRAGQAEKILEQNGFSDVVNIGGLVDWIEAGGEIQQQP